MPPRYATYVPPPPEHVEGLMANLDHYIQNDTDLPLLLRVAAIHAQFELIHPCLDGNGRLGRMLITLLLNDHEYLPDLPLYLSECLNERRSEYDQYLSDIQKVGNWESWFLFFLHCVQTAATDAVATMKQLSRQVHQDRQRLLATDDVTVSALQLFERLPDHLVISMPLVTLLLETTKPTAGKAIEVLQRAGILCEIGKRKKNRAYSYKPYIDLLD